MTTQLTVAKTDSFLALQQGGEILEAMQANLGDGASLRESDLTRVTTPAGGGTTWTVPSLMGDEETKELIGILVYMTPRGVLWDSDEPAEGNLPVLVSDDLKTARRVRDRADVDEAMNAEIDRCTGEDGAVDWGELSYTQWGSGKGGAGKAAKEQRVLYLLREEDTLPIVVAIQPGSLKGWKDFILALTKAGVPYYRAVVKLSLSTEKSANGTKFSQVHPEIVSVLSREDGSLVREHFGDSLEKASRSGFEG